MNIFSGEYGVEYDGFVSEYFRWIQDHTGYREIEPMFNSLADVPTELLNPQPKTRLQRIWVMVSKSIYGHVVVHPICLQTGELLSIGGRQALYQLDTTSGKNYKPVLRVGICTFQCQIGRSVHLA